MVKKDSISYTVFVAFALCLVCSIIVSVASVMLRPAQTANKAKDFKKNILSAAGLLEQDKSVEQLFSKVQTKIVNLDTGKYTDAVNPDNYDERQASKDPEMSEKLPPSEDIAKIGRREKYAEIYVAKNPKGGNILILPVRGYGLWGTLYGFLALEDDYNTIVGLGFYEHKETPGLGAEVDNPAWKSIWDGKKAYDKDGDVAITVIKGPVDSKTPNAQYKVDGLSGATLTSRGVDNLLKFWLGKEGYKPFLQNLKNGEA